MKLIFAAILVARVASAACPTAVTTAIETKFPKSSIKTCKPEHDQFEVKLMKADGSPIEADVTAAGEIVQLEEVVALDTVPEAVSAAFRTRYPKAKATRAERQTPAKGKISYELAWTDNGKKREATFDEHGVFVDEE